MKRSEDVVDAEPNMIADRKNWVKGCYLYGTLVANQAMGVAGRRGRDERLVAACRDPCSFRRSATGRCMFRCDLVACFYGRHIFFFYCVYIPFPSYHQS